MRRGLLVGAVLAGVWLWRRGVRRPGQVPDVLKEEWARLRRDIDEAAAAGRAAMAREEEAFDRRLREAAPEVAAGR